MAHKKGLGSSRNGRDSHSKRLGVKVFAGQSVTVQQDGKPAGEIASLAVPPPFAPNVTLLPAGERDLRCALLFVDGSSVVDGEELSGVSVTARVVAHERGPKLRVVKFKPKRGYKRRTGHRQNLTRIEVTEVKHGS